MSAKSDRPRWIWLQGGHDPKIAIHLNLLGRSSGLSTAEIGSGIMTATISRNGILGRELHDDLTIFYRAPSITDSSSANKCISIATAYLSPLRWVGSVVVCATLCDGSLRDLEPSDYRYVVDALSVSDLQNDAWLAFTEEGPPKQAPRTGRVEAVCIDCDGERLIRGTASARKILLPRLHPQGKWVRTTELPRIADLYTSDGINRTSVKPSFTNRLEIPIRTWQVAPDRAWTVAASRNPLVSFLHFNTRRLNNKLTSNDIDVAMKAELYQTCPGSVFLARSDGKPLLPEHVEAIAAFARFVILPHAQHLGGYDEVDWSRPEDIVGSREMVVLLTEFEKYRGGQAEMNEAAILSFIERRVFRKFWELYKEKKGWEDVLSPYDV
ncbi:hypothetical protein BU16DRAFT_521743 [Lophium mytilinum]|uniref:Uncharacterized protein n=1 Tax=Lophium mytilinum TaxID=390894 RepID=A0A6A6REE6_9PEZI|nr:hypothetical protein BU16DRAFT_521743 [Lophium mytilinum]